MKHKSPRTRGLGRGRGTVTNGNQDSSASSLGATAASNEDAEPASSRQSQKKRSLSGDEHEDLYPEDTPSVSQDGDQSKPRQKKQRKTEQRRSSRRRGRSADGEEKDHFSCLSLEVICRILNYLPLTSILLLQRQCKKLQHAVDMHLRIRKSIDLCQGSLFGWMPHALTDTSLASLLARCKELVHVYGIHPPSLARRRSRTCNQLTVPGVVDALSGCPKLQGVEVSSIFLLEAILNYLPHLQILGTFRNRDGGLPFTSANSLTIPSNARITSLYLFGVSLPELPRINTLTHLSLRWVKLTSSHAFSGFAAPMLQTFVMAHCQGPDNPLRYVPLFAGLAASRSLSRLELVRVNYLGGLIQHIVEDCWKLQGFRSLQSVTFAACKHALEADIGFLAITAENRLEELRVQPSLTKDSLFSALSMAGVTFPHFDSIGLGYVDSEAHEDSRRQGFNFLGGAEAPESPAMLTDIGMGSVGQCFPTVTRLSVYNCPHLQYPTNWLSAGNPMHLFRSLSHLHLHRCHSIRLVNFGDFVSLLPCLEILHLEQMFREPPKGCARVGLSAGTGLGVSSALVQNHHAAAAAAANGPPPNNPPNNNNNNNNMANNNNLPNNNNAGNNNNNAGNNNNNAANNNNGADDIDVDGGEDDVMDHDDENLIVDEDVEDALDERGMVEEEEEEALNDVDDDGTMLLSCDSDATGDSNFDDTDYDPRQPETYQSTRETNVPNSDSSQRSRPSQQRGDLNVCNSQDGPSGDGMGSSRGKNCFDRDCSTSGNTDIASGRRENQRGEEQFGGESSGLEKSCSVDGRYPRKGDCIERESSDSGNVSSSLGGVRCPSRNQKKDDNVEVREIEDEEKGEHQMSDETLPVMRCAHLDSGNREGDSQVNSARNKRHTQGCSLLDTEDDTEEQEARKICSCSTVDEFMVNSQSQPNSIDTGAGDQESPNTRETCSSSASSTKASMRVKIEPDLNTTSAVDCSYFQRKLWRESSSPSCSQEPRPGQSTWMDNKRPSASSSSGRVNEGSRMSPAPSAAASSSCKRESREVDDWEDLDSPSGSKGRSFVGKGKALMGKRQAAVKKSRPVVPSPPQSSSSSHRDTPDLKTQPAEDINTREQTSVSRAEGSSHSSDVHSSQPGSSGAQTSRSCHASQRVEPTAPPWSDEESCSLQGGSSWSSSAPGTSAGSGTGNRSTPVLDSPGKRCPVSKQINRTQGSPLAAQSGLSSGSQSKGPRTLGSEQASSSAREGCSSSAVQNRGSRTLSSKPQRRANPGGRSSREELPGRGMASSSRHFNKCPFIDTSDEDEDEPPRLLIDESWRGSEEEEEGEEEASDKACQAVSEEIREATRRAREQQSQASSSQGSGNSYRDCLRSASRLRSQQQPQDSESTSTASLPKKSASKPKGTSAASTTASVLPASSSAAATPSTSSSFVGAGGSGGGFGGFRCDPGFSRRFRSSRTSPKRRRRKPKMCDKSTSTSDPVMEDDHVQGLKISSRSLISLTLQMVGITDLVIDDCLRLSSINVSACRVLRRVELQDLPVLRRVGFVQCRKLEELQLLAELTDLPECDRLIHLRPMKPVNRDQLEKLLFGTADMECHVCLIYDDCPDPNETLHERTHVSDLLDVFSSLNQHLLEQDRLPYGLGSDSRLLYTMSGEELDCPSWTVVTDIPWLRLLHSSPSFLDRSATGWQCGEVGRTAVEELLQMLGPHISSLEELGLGLFPHCMLVYVSLSDVSGTPQDDYYI